MVGLPYGIFIINLLLTIMICIDCTDWKIMYNEKEKMIKIRIYMKRLPQGVLYARIGERKK